MYLNYISILFFKYKDDKDLKDDKTVKEVYTIIFYNSIKV